MLAAPSFAHLPLLDLTPSGWSSGSSSRPLSQRFWQAEPQRGAQGWTCSSVFGCTTVAASACALVTACSRASGQAPRGQRRRGRGCVVRLSSEDAEPKYPWSFTGRVRFRPAFVSAPSGPVAEGVQVLSLFGITVGGSVCLEYDMSPVGPYLEVVQMAAVVFSERLWTLALWGSRLMVSDAMADSANGDVWGVPSECRDISFEAGGPPGVVTDAEGRLRIGDWGGMTFADAGAETWGQLPIWWTPTLKALWAPLSPWCDESKGGSLPLRRLRLSASALRLRWAPVGDGVDSFGGLTGGGKGAFGGPRTESFRVPMPFVVEVDGVLIEIGEIFDGL
mmetsp:Transcript_54397/g.156415  ORF Transcript_54397/g.156415 Transcript_54397/m.156415 type:complete len:335 (-) Transcript_54397:54-1058(-)